MEQIHGSRLWPANMARFLQAWAANARIALKLTVYETYLDIRRLLGLRSLAV